MGRLLRRSALIAAALLLLIATACGGNSPGEAYEDGSLQRVLDAGRLVVGLDVNFPPMGFTDETGEIVGFDIDLAGECCKRLGIELVCRSIDWDAKEELLNNGEIDCIWNGMSITGEREESMRLSSPYVKNKLIFLVPVTSEVRGIYELSGKRIGVQAGSTAVELLEASDISDDVTVVTSDSNTGVMEMLRTGEVDAALIDSLFVYYAVLSGSERFYVLSDALGEEKCAIGFRKDDRSLRDRVQEIMGEMAADGTLAEISQKWFGYDITIAR